MVVDHLSEFPRDTTTQTAVLVVKIHQLASDCITENIVGRPIVDNSDIVCVIKRTTVLSDYQHVQLSVEILTIF